MICGREAEDDFPALTVPAGADFSGVAGIMTYLACGAQDAAVALHAETARLTTLSGSGLA